MRDLLAQRIVLGDQQAFELLFRKYYVRLCGFANKFLNNPDEAQDIVQEVFSNIWENRELIDSDNSLKAYIFKITQNLSINKLRRKEVESKYTEIYKLVYVDHKEFSSHESLLAKELEEDIIQAIDKLPPECSKVFKMSRVDGLKYHEIAKVLNISVKTVETQMSKALRILRSELIEYTSLLAIFILLGDSRLQNVIF
jgi:RNA polymerase sigma-70 factor (ECF subfamily)